MAGWPDVRISARQGFFDGILDGILAARGMLWLDALTGCSGWMLGWGHQVVDI